MGGGGEYKQMCRSIIMCMPCMISMFIYILLCVYGVETSQKDTKIEICVMMHETSAKTYHYT